MGTMDSGHTIGVFKTNLCHVFSFYNLFQIHKDASFIANSAQQWDDIKCIQLAFDSP